MKKGKERKRQIQGGNKCNISQKETSHQTKANATEARRRTWHTTVMQKRSAAPPTILMRDDTQIDDLRRKIINRRRRARNSIKALMPSSGKEGGSRRLGV